MFTGNVNKIPNIDGGTIDVVMRASSCGAGSVVTSKPAAGVIHTTEGRTVPAYAGSAPHFTVGPFVVGGKWHIVQHVPLGRGACALQNDAGGIETNHWARVQVELVGFSTRAPWLPAEPAQVLLASLFEWCQKEMGIAEKYEYDSKKLATGTWAIESNPWRKNPKFGKASGWHGHIAVPENDHWDPGALRMSVLLKQEAGPKMVTAYQFVASIAETEARAAGKKVNHSDLKEITPHFKSLKDLLRFAAKAKTRKELQTHLNKKGHRVKLVTRKIDEDKVR